VEWQRIPTTALPNDRYEASAGAKEEMAFYVASGELMKAFH